MSEQPFSRKELQDLRDRCNTLLAASEWMTSSWVLAYNQLAQAADYLDAIMARAQVYQAVDRVNFTTPFTVPVVTNGAWAHETGSPSLVAVMGDSRRCSRCGIIYQQGCVEHCCTDDVA